MYCRVSLLRRLKGGHAKYKYIETRNISLILPPLEKVGVYWYTSFFSVFQIGKYLVIVLGKLFLFLNESLCCDTLQE